MRVDTRYINSAESPLLFRSLWLCDVFRALINSLVCWLFTAVLTQKCPKCIAVAVMSGKSSQSFMVTDKTDGCGGLVVAVGLRELSGVSSCESERS